MWQHLLENSRVGQFKYADVSVWDWAAQLTGMPTAVCVLGLLGVMAIYKPTRPFVILGVLAFVLL